MSSSRRFFTAAEAARQIHENASELVDVDSDTESNFLRVNQEMGNIFCSYNNSFDTTCPDSE